MRTFHEVIVSVVGNEVMVSELKVRLDEGIRMLDGPRGQELEDVVHDIAVALLGRSIALGPVLGRSGVTNGTRVHGLGCDNAR